MWSAAMMKYFRSLSFSQLLFKDRVFSTRSQCLCSKHISDSSKSSQSQIDFFFLTLSSFTSATGVKQTSFPFPAGILWWQCGSTMAWNANFLLGGSTMPGTSFADLPRAPRTVRAEPGRRALDHHLRSFVAKHFVWCTSILILDPHVLALLAVFWG